MLGYTVAARQEDKVELLLQRGAVVNDVVLVRCACVR